MIGRACIVLLLAALTLAGSGRGAEAHAVLRESAPADGAALAESPDEIRLVFNEPVAPVAIRLFDAAGTEVAGVGVEAVDRTVILRLDRALPTGTYVVSYRLTSQDSHGVSGSIVFAVGEAAVVPPQTAATAAEGWRIAVAVNRFLWIVLSLAAAGLVLFRMLCGALLTAQAARRLDRRLRTAAAAAVPLALLAIGFEGGLLLGADAGALLDANTWQVGGATTLRRSMAIGVVGVAMLAASPRSTFLRAIGVVLIVASFGLTGHAATVEPAAAMGPTVAVHAGLAAFWWGGLLGLSVTLERAAAATAPAVQRFSRAALAAVPMLLALGIAIAFVQVRHLQALVEPGYGLMLCGKLLLASGLLAIASYNRLRLTPRISGGNAAAGQTLRRSVRIEIALVLAIFAVTASLGQLPPPRTQAAANAAVTAEAVSSKGSKATVEISPGRAGRNEIFLQLTDATGRSLAAQEVALAVSLSSVGIEPIRRRLHEVAPGRYHLPELTLPIPGRWSVRIEALVSDFDEQNFTIEADIR